MAEKLWKEQQISFGNGTKYSDFIDGKYILLISAQKDPIVQRKSRLIKTICWYFLLKFLVSALIDMINMPVENP